MRIVINGQGADLYEADDGSWAAQLDDGRWMLFGYAVALAYAGATQQDDRPKAPTFVDGPRGKTAGRPVGRDDNAVVAHAVRYGGKTSVLITGARKVHLKGDPISISTELPASPIPAGTVLEQWARVRAAGETEGGRALWLANLRLSVEKARARLVRAEEAQAQAERARQREQEALALAEARLAEATGQG